MSTPSSRSSTRSARSPSARAWSPARDPWPDREEAVRNRPERLPEVVAVGEPRARDRREPGAGLELLRERRERAPERRLHRRARAADRLLELEVVCAVPERSADQRLDVVRRRLGEQPAVDRDLALRRDDVSLMRGVDHRRREREGEQRLDEVGSIGCSARARSSASSSGGASPRSASSKPFASGISSRGGS